MKNIAPKETLSTAVEQWKQVTSAHVRYGASLRLTLKGRRDSAVALLSYCNTNDEKIFLTKCFRIESEVDI